MSRRRPFPHRPSASAPLLLVVGMTVLLGTASTVDAGTCWEPPVVGIVTDPFRQPPCPYCAGQRGIEYRVDPGSVVRAVESGTVTWAGVVAGTRYVVVRHANGWRATYGQLVETPLGTGDAVLVGRTIGVASGRFHFGVRDGESYIDPSNHLGRLVGRPRLVPTDHTPARRAPAPRLRCENSSSPTSPGLTR